MFVDRPLTVRDTIRVRDVVVERVDVFRPVEVERLRVDTIYAPVDLGRYTLAPPKPLHFERSGRTAVVTSFDPDSRAWQQVRYQVPVKRWSVSLTGSMLYVPQAGRLGTTVGPRVRWDRWSVGGGIGAPVVGDGDPFWYGSLSYSLPLL